MSGYCILATSLLKTREIAAWTVAAISLVALLWPRRPMPPPPPPLRLALLAAAGDAFSLSPDGTRLAFPLTKDGRTRIWIRALRDENPQPLAGTEGASPEEPPVWSPDGRELLYFSRGRLMRIAAAGGAPQVLTEAAEVNGAAWSSDGTILYTPSPRGALCRLPAIKVREPKSAEEEVALRRPQFLPDGRHFFYIAVKRPADSSVVTLASLDDASSRPLLTAASQVQYAPGWLLFVREERLFARPFDDERRVFTGDAVLLAAPVGSAPARNWAQFSAAGRGLLAYSGSELRMNELVWTDRTGRRLAALGKPGHYSSVDLSPDGRTVLVSDREGRTSDVWSLDAMTGVAIRMSSGNGVESNRLPVWSPDGASVAWANTQADGRQNITLKRPGRPAVPVWPTNGGFPYPLGWSRDGRLLLYFDSLPKAVRAGLWTMAADGANPTQALQPAAGERLETAAFSPDGQCLAAAGDGLLLRSVNTTSKITDSAAAYPRWRRDGKELYYWSAATSELMVAEVSGCRAAEARPLFPVRLNRSPLSRPYDVWAEGSRFLLIQPTAQPEGSPMTVVVNWTGLLNR